MTTWAEDRESPVTATLSRGHIESDTEGLCRELFHFLASQEVGQAYRHKARSKKQVSGYRLPSLQELGLDALQLDALRKQLILNKLG